MTWVHPSFPFFALPSGGVRFLRPPCRCDGPLAQNLAPSRPTPPLFLPRHRFPGAAHALFPFTPVFFPPPLPLLCYSSGTLGNYLRLFLWSFSRRPPRPSSGGARPNGLFVGAPNLPFSLGPLGPFFKCSASRGNSATGLFFFLAFPCLVLFFSPSGPLQQRGRDLRIEPSALRVNSPPSLFCSFSPSLFSQLHDFHNTLFFLKFLWVLNDSVICARWSFFFTSISSSISFFFPLLFPFLFLRRLFRFLLL